MSTSTMCSQCLRTLRRSMRADKAKTLQQNRSRPSVRSLSTRPTLFQEVQQRQQTPELTPQFPPITTSTVTANVTAGEPVPSGEDAAPAPSLSTAGMQRAISSRLGSSGRPALTTSIAQTLRRTATKTTETYITYGLTESLFKACSAQADYTVPEDQRAGYLSGAGPPKTAGGEDLGIPLQGPGSNWWFDELGLQPTFSTWSQVAYLHMYLLTVRLRALESSTTFLNYQRYLLEHFSHTAEEKMIILHNMGARGIRNRYLKDLFLQWRGLLAAYDEGMVRGDAVLAGAVWRNLWKGQEDVDWTKVAQVVAWMRRVTNMLGDVEVQQLVGELDGKDGLFGVGRRGVMQLVAKDTQGFKEAL